MKTQRLLSQCLSAGSVAALVLLLTVLFTGAAQAHIVRIEVQHTQSPAFGGRSFGAVGQYEALIGVAYGETDPGNPRNKIIQDIAIAPRNSRGMVEYSMDFYILRPIRAAQGNHVIFYDVVNRGNKTAWGTYTVAAGGSNDPANTEAAAGDGFFMNHGYTVVWSGWQADVLPAKNKMTLTVPTITNSTAADSLTAILDTELMTVTPAKSLHLSSAWFTGMATASYPTVSLDNKTAALTRRVHQDDTPETVPASEWSFADCSATAFPGRPSATDICLRGGFDPNYIYDLHYTARDPKVLGLGFASTRDFVSYLRRTKEGEELMGLTAASAPVAAIMYGQSQSGRYVRTYLDLGFNTDERGDIVFEGMIPHLAAARIPLNVRWGQPSRASGQHEDHFFPAGEEPLTWVDYVNADGKKSASLLDRCQQSSQCPKIMQEFTETEYWQGRVSLDTTDSLGKVDLSVPENVRIYFLASTEHAPAAVPAKGICQQLSNPAPYRETLRALLVSLTSWILDNKPPPASRYATLKDGTLVALSGTGFPAIPNVTYPAKINGFEALDFGAAFSPRDESGIVVPAKKVTADARDHAHVVLVPKVDKDGNNLAGIRSATIQAPLGTYTGWNLRAAGFGEGDLCALNGSYIPFAAHKADREATGDPRLSLEERYGNHAGYVAAVTAATKALTHEGYLLGEDAQRLIAEAQASGVLQ